MADDSSEKHDASSIRPVSTLLTHFESFGGSRPTTPGNSQGGSQSNVLGEFPRGRSSFVAPRRSVIAESPNNEGRRASYVPSHAHPPASPNPSLSSPVSRRPASTFISSYGRASPAFTLQQPPSPSRKTQTPRTNTPPQASQSLSTDQTSVSPARQTSLDKIRAASTSRDSSPAKLPPLASSDGVNIPAGRPKAPPPPVNRAAKPLQTASLAPIPEPVRERSRDRVSPFSTPPGSDDDEVSGQRPPQPPRPLPATQVARSQATPPSPTSAQQISDANRDIPPAPPRDHRRLRDSLPAQHLASSPRLDSSDLPAHRPQLPSRSQAAPQNISPNSIDTRKISPSSGSRAVRQSLPPPRPSEASKNARPPSEYMLPPRRAATGDFEGHESQPSKSLESNNTQPASTFVSPTESTVAPPSTSISRSSTATSMESAALDLASKSIPNSEYPDTSQMNRRPPKSKCSVGMLATQYDARHFQMSGRRVCTAGSMLRSWDITNAHLLLDIAPAERELRYTALVFKPTASSSEDGTRVWVGTNSGDLHEIDLHGKAIVQSRPQAHEKREVISLHRSQNSIWSLDDSGRLLVWTEGSAGIPSLLDNPQAFRVSKGHTCSLVVKRYLWLAAGREIRIYNPMGGENSFHVTAQALGQASLAEITSGAVISNQQDRVFFGHSDGKVSIYSTSNFACLGVVAASAYKINCMIGAGHFLWAGFNTGMIYVYDTTRQPWTVRKEWQAHEQPVTSFTLDASSVWKLGYLLVGSIGLDNTVRLWDGMLEDDWLEDDMRQHDVEYCAFKEVKTMVMTWNAGASTPASLRQDQKDNNIFREILRPDDPPDILVFGFQELVDLEDKKLTAKSLFKTNRKKDSSEREHMSRQYRAWRDYLVELIEDSMAGSDAYQLVHTASLVGLFTCIFVKAAQWSSVSQVAVAEIKRGLGGLHGNKGAIILRFQYDDSSLCFVNCHLAAGQSQTVNRNNDLSAILEASSLSPENKLDLRQVRFIGGGDGSMVMDYEICVLNGDLNYRIDTMSRDTVVKAVQNGHLQKLLERDQLLVSRRRAPSSRLRAFQEAPLNFAPTYKYDVGTDRYDTSEKHRAPAWCDRLLYRGVGRMKQLEYRRHELRLSDHRPVSGLFAMRVKSVNEGRRSAVRQQSEQRQVRMKQALARDLKLDYLVNVLGLDLREAEPLVNG